MTSPSPATHKPAPTSPAIITKRILDKLEKAFAMGCTDKEACLYSGIGMSSLYRYQNENPDFQKRKEILKENPVLRARAKVIQEVDNDVTTAKWYLERKRRDEFGQSVDINHNHSDNLTAAQLEQRIIAIFQAARARALADPTIQDAEIVTDATNEAQDTPTQEPD